MIRWRGEIYLSPAEYDAWLAKNRRRAFVLQTFGVLVAASLVAAFIVWAKK